MPKRAEDEAEMLGNQSTPVRRTLKVRPSPVRRAGRVVTVKSSSRAPTTVAAQAPEALFLGRLLNQCDAKGGPLTGQTDERSSRPTPRRLAETTYWRVRIGLRETVAAADLSLDAAYLQELSAREGNVVLHGPAESPTILGALATHRPVHLDERGDLRVSARRIVLDAADRVLARVPGAFMEVKDDQVEIYANRVVTRARELAKMLAAMIKIN